MPLTRTSPLRRREAAPAVPDLRLGSPRPDVIGMGAPGGHDQARAELRGRGAGSRWRRGAFLRAGVHRGVRTSEAAGSVPRDKLGTLLDCACLAALLAMGLWGEWIGAAIAGWSGR